jgi:pyrroline-5-carboxylate reductase
MKIGILGAGNMAEALIKGVISAGKFKPADISVSDILKDRLEHLKKSCGVNVEPDNASLINKSDLVVIAVKPKDVDLALADLKANLGAKTVVLSIAAAISTSYIENVIGRKTAVIRAMPNTPALVGSGMAAVSRGKNTVDRDMEEAKKILGAVGKVIEVEEKYMDIVTAVSGSGPAYVFLFLEALVEAGVKSGLDKGTAETLAYNTVLGAAKMVLETKESPESLRKKVTSPGGTTEEAVKVFESKGLKRTVEEAVKAAMEKSKKLTK